MMKDYFIKVQLAGLTKIRVLIFSELPRPNHLTFTLYKDDNSGVKLNLMKSTATTSLTVFELALEQNFDFGHHYSLVVSNFPPQVVDVTSAIHFPEFADLFDYDGDDLGAIYYQDHTDFALWAPLASDVKINLEQEDGSFISLPLKRTDFGVYRITIQGDLINKKYQYQINNSGVISLSNDPWGKGTSFNSTYSAVVDYLSIANRKLISPQMIIKHPVDATIYEVNIRDFSEDNDSDIVHKGKYLGFVEPDRKSKDLHPAGLDYLKYLGVSHVQLNPVLDFDGVDDFNPSKSYNWGYDVISFFALEGSYSNHPEIPMERLKEFANLVDRLHQNDIRVILDVVYNHIYHYMDSCFEKILPGYFFRKNKSGEVSNASGCGDDFASERFMARKAIKDSIAYLIKTFDVDGFRFDLMGLIDIETIHQCTQIAKSLKQDVILYGEGWNMGYELPFEMKACSENARKLPQVGFFNSMFRDIVKGSTFDKEEKGYASGNTDCSTGLEFLISGSILPYTFTPLYHDANQSINYVECHDNQTLFDKLMECCKDEDLETLLKRVRFANELTLLSNGVAFLHMGQEIGLSKNGNDNTYNMVKINNMPWALVDKRFAMVSHLKETIRMRKMVQYLKLYQPDEINQYLKFYQNYDEKTLYIDIQNPTDKGLKEYTIILNPNDYEIHFDLKDDYYLVYGPGGFPNDPNLRFSHGVLGPLSIHIFGKENKDA